MLKSNPIINKISYFYGRVFLDIFFPKRCVGCGASDTFLCYKCAGEIETFVTPTCNVCGKINKFGQTCSGCRAKTKSNLTGLIIAARYDSGPVKEMIHHLKYSGFTELVPAISELICQRLKTKMPRGDLVIVPIPLHQKREAKRGFNQAELIARFVSKRFNIRGGNALARTRNTETQVKLNRFERMRNLSGAFVCLDEKLIKERIILLIDDVTTTGSTLNECACVLKNAGAKRVWGIVVAKRI